jgi:hypothetical protein
MNGIPHPWEALLSIMEIGRFPMVDAIEFAKQQNSDNCNALLKYLGGKSRKQNDDKSEK